MTLHARFGWVGHGEILTERNTKPTSLGGDFKLDHFQGSGGCLAIFRLVDIRDIRFTEHAALENRQRICRFNHRNWEICVVDVRVHKIITQLLPKIVRCDVENVVQFDWRNFLCALFHQQEGWPDSYGKRPKWVGYRDDVKLMVDIYARETRPMAVRALRR
jgi:hypothetical protein